MNGKQIIRQGDVLLVPADRKKPRTKAIAKGHVVLALGEVTGHHHSMTGAVAEFAVEGKRLLWVEAPAQLVHQEHNPIEVQSGVYWIVRQREYTPQEIRRVAD